MREARTLIIKQEREGQVDVTEMRQKFDERAAHNSPVNSRRENFRKGNDLQTDHGLSLRYVLTVAINLCAMIHAADEGFTDSLRANLLLGERRSNLEML